MERPLHWLKAQVHMEPTASSIENDKWPVSIDLTHHGRKGGKKAPHRIAGEVGGTDLCSGVRHLKILCDNVPDQRLAAHESAITHDDAREAFASGGYHFDPRYPMASTDSNSLRFFCTRSCS